MRTNIVEYKLSLTISSLSPVPRVCKTAAATQPLTVPEGGQLTCWKIGADH